MPGNSEPMTIIHAREISALLNPRPAVLLTCCDEQGKPNIITIAWLTPLSHDPPLLGVSIAPSRYSHSLIDQTGEFVVNVVSRQLEQAVILCGAQSGAQVDKFQAAGLTALPAHHVRPPLIGGALAHLECRVVNQLHTGDHTFFVGQVLHAQALGGSFDEGWLEQKGDVLLCLQRGEFGTWFRA